MFRTRFLFPSDICSFSLTPCIPLCFSCTIALLGGEFIKTASLLKPHLAPILCYCSSCQELILILVILAFCLILWFLSSDKMEELTNLFVPSISYAYFRFYGRSFLEYLQPVEDHFFSFDISFIFFMSLCNVCSIEIVCSLIVMPFIYFSLASMKLVCEYELL